MPMLGSHRGCKKLPTGACLISGMFSPAPRALHLCLLCEGGEEEGFPHFLLLCSRYSAVRPQFGGLLDGVVDTAAFINGQDQAAVAHAFVSMLLLRVVALHI